jgi:hypothetical protein
VSEKINFILDLDEAKALCEVGTMGVWQVMDNPEKYNKRIADVVDAALKRLSDMVHPHHEHTVQYDLLRYEDRVKIGEVRLTDEQFNAWITKSHKFENGIELVRLGDAPADVVVPNVAPDTVVMLY